MGDLVLLATGVPGIAVVSYAVVRLVDKVLYLVGLRMVLRATRREDRVAAITAYRDTARRRGQSSSS
jgi:hypothetical protein